MNFLGKLAAVIIPPLVASLSKELKALAVTLFLKVKDYLASLRARREREAEARRIREQTEQAQTPEERDEAARSNHSRGI